jgi:uncharacterized protein YbjT (DUF2867 family)
MARTTATVLGGTGFLGSRIVRRLAGNGWTVRSAARRPRRGGGNSGVRHIQADLRDEDSIAGAIAGSDAVVNAVSLYVEKGGTRFSTIHEEGAAMLSALADRYSVTRLIHISGIGASPLSRSPYIRARGMGEVRVRDAFPGAVIVRPSVMFGPGDGFCSRLAAILQRSPVFPLIGATTRLQPVFVDDVAEAVVRVLESDNATRVTYELGGPDIYTMREIVSYLQNVLGLNRRVLPIPLPLATVPARLLERLPSPPLTTTQLDLLYEDNVTADGAPGLEELGISAAPLDQIVPRYVPPVRR